MNRKTLTVVIVLVVALLLGFYMVNSSNENSSKTTEVVKDSNKEKKIDKENTENKPKEKEKNKRKTSRKDCVHVTTIARYYGGMSTIIDYSKDRELTKFELSDFNRAFRFEEHWFPKNKGENKKWPDYKPMVAYMFTSYYDKPEDINIGNMVYYMKRQHNIHEEEFEALKKLDNFPYKDVEKLEDMPTPISRIRKVDVAEYFYNCTGVDIEKAISNSKAKNKPLNRVLYLGEPYNHFYALSSKFDLDVFVAKSGYCKDSVITLYSDKAKLVLRQEGRKLYIVSHTKK